MILNSIKRIICVFIFLLTAVSCTSSRIVYEPFGITDKSFPVIEIDIKGKQNVGARKYVVDKVVFERLCKIIDDNLEKSEEEKSKYGIYYQFGLYKVMYKNKRTKIEYITASTDNSMFFLKNQLEVVQGNKELYQEFERLIKRFESLTEYINSKDTSSN